MAEDNTKVKDRFARAIPGGSLTSAPGSETYTRPPSAVSASQLYDMVYPGLQDSDAQEQIVSLVASGTPVSEIGRSIVMNAFARGLANPDVAELTLPAINMTIADIAIRSLGEMPIKLTNNDGGGRMTDQELARDAMLLKQMRRKNPKVAKAVELQMNASREQEEAQEREYLAEQSKKVRSEREKEQRTGFIAGRESEQS